MVAHVQARLSSFKRQLLSTASAIIGLYFVVHVYRSIGSSPGNVEDKNCNFFFSIVHLITLSAFVQKTFRPKEL